MSYMGNRRTQFSVKYDAVCGCDFFFASIVKFFPATRITRSLALLAKRKEEKSEGIKCCHVCAK